MGYGLKPCIPCWKPIIYHNFHPLSKSVESESEYPLVAFMKWLTTWDNLIHKMLIFSQQWQSRHKPAVSNPPLIHIESVGFSNKHFWFQSFPLLTTYLVGPTITGIQSKNLPWTFVSPQPLDVAGVPRQQAGAGGELGILPLLYAFLLAFLLEFGVDLLRIKLIYFITAVTHGSSLERIDNIEDFCPIDNLTIVSEPHDFINYEDLDFKLGFIIFNKMWDKIILFQRQLGNDRRVRLFQKSV